MHCVSRGGCYLVNSFCDLQEENQWKKESYQACWLGLVLETRPQYRMTLSEKDRVLRESYEQQQVVHVMVERSPNQTLRLSSSTGAVTEYQQPLVKTSVGPHHAKTSFESSVAQGIMENEGVALDREDVSQELTKPVRMNFRASSLMSSPREVSHRVQKRE